MTRATLALLLLAGCTKEPVASSSDPGTGSVGQTTGVAEVVGCAEAWAASDAAGAPRVARPGCRKPWTVLMYMAADTADLPAHARGDLAEWAAGFRGAGPDAELRADVVVQLDVDAPPGLARLEVGAGGPREVEALAEHEGPPADALERFVAWGLAQYPSDRVMVVLWGHGQGWRPAGAAAGPIEYGRSDSFGGFGFDDSQKTVVDTPALVAALDRALAGARAGVDIDVLVVDACLMQTVEVSAGLAEVARYLVGHEQVDPYAGFPYDRLLARLLAPAPAPACAATDEACRVAAALPDLLFAPSSLAGDDFVASAVIGERVTGALVPALQRLGAALSAYLAEDPLRGADVLAMLRSRRPGEAVPGFQGNTVDLGVLLVRLEQTARAEAARWGASATIDALLAALADARAALATSVLDVAVGATYAADESYVDTPGPAGVSVWLPPDPERFARRRGDFASSPLHDPPGPDLWIGWLDRLYAAPPPP